MIWDSISGIIPASCAADPAVQIAFLKQFLSGEMQVWEMAAAGDETAKLAGIVVTHFHTDPLLQRRILVVYGATSHQFTTLDGWGFFQVG